MTIVERINTLREGAVIWRQSPDGDVAALGETLSEWLDQGEGQIDAALGLGPSWRQDAAREERDAIVRRIVETYYGEHSTREAAKRFARRLAAFREAGDWRAHRAASTCPFQPGIRADLWHLLRAVDRPIGAETIRKILGG